MRWSLVTRNGRTVLFYFVPVLGLVQGFFLRYVYWLYLCSSWILVYFFHNVRGRRMLSSLHQISAATLIMVQVELCGDSLIEHWYLNAMRQGLQLSFEHQRWDWTMCSKYRRYSRFSSEQNSEGVCDHFGLRAFASQPQFWSSIDNLRLYRTQLNCLVPGFWGMGSGCVCKVRDMPEPTQWGVLVAFWLCQGTKGKQLWCYYWSTYIR